MTNDYNIPRNHKDIGLRSLAVMFKDEFLPFTGIQIPKVKDVIQTNVATIEMKDRGMDLNFLLEDDTIAHIEFESDALNVDDLIRFAHYDLQLYKQRKQNIRRIIIFSAGVPFTTLQKLDIGSVKQKHECLFLEHDFDGDEIFSKIKEIIKNDEVFSNIEKLQVILLPMMKSKKSTTSKRAYELTEKLLKYRNDDLAYYLIGAMVAVNYSGIEQTEKEKILEVLEMAKPFEELYKKYEEKGKREEKILIAKKLIVKGIEPEIISEATGLSLEEIDELRRIK